MLTRADKQSLFVVGLLLIAAIASYIATINDSAETVWVPDGLYVLAYTGTPFLQDDLPGYIEKFMADTGTEVNVILTPDMESALIRAVVDNIPIDVIMVPFDMREEFRHAGRIIELHKVLADFPNPNFQTAMRWLWSSINDQPICGFLIGEFGDPTFACIWYQTKRAEQAAELIKHLVVNTSVSEPRLMQVNHFARKDLVEQDYGSIYDYLLHPSRREVTDRDTFVNRSTLCPNGIVRDVRVTHSEVNIAPRQDPRTGIRYEIYDLFQHRVEYNCVQGEQRRRGISSVITTRGYPYPSVFIPYETFATWITDRGVEVQ